MLRQPISQFAQGNQLVEFEVPGIVERLFLVPSPSHIPALLKQGVRRGQIWLASEAKELHAAGVTREELVTIAGIKLLFDGEKVWTRPDAQSQGGSR